MQCVARRIAPHALGAAARPAAAAAARPIIRARLLRPVQFGAGSSRWASSSPSSTSPRSRPSRALRNGFLRVALAVAAVYWYNTSPVFADEPPAYMRSPPPAFSDADMPTVDAIVQEKRQRAAAAKAKTPGPAAAAAADAPAPTSEAEQQPRHEPGSPEALEHEAGQQGAFDPETGEINWDCPCLGGMADGPCGEEFKAAFSCFVHSKEDPKGMDCIERFAGMRDCFRQHPDVYGNELNDDDNDDEDAAEGQPPATTDAPLDHSAEKKALALPAAATAPEETPAQEMVAAKVTTGKSAESSTSTTASNRRKETDKASAQKSNRAADPQVSQHDSDATVSYADVAARGAKQSPEEAAAPQPPQIEPSETASTVSLVDVDTPSVRTVPSDFLEQDVQTETQADRIGREEVARAEADLAKKKGAGKHGKHGGGGGGKGGARAAAAEANAKVRRVDAWIAAKVAGLGDTASTLIVVSNFAAVAAVSTLLGMRAWGAYERGRLSWKSVGLGLGVTSAVALVEGGFARYFYKGRAKKQ